MRRLIRRGADGRRVMSLDEATPEMMEEQPAAIALTGDQEAQLRAIEQQSMSRLRIRGGGTADARARQPESLAER